MNSASLQTTTTPAPALDDWKTLPEFIAMDPQKFSERTLRWYLRGRAENGLAPAVTRLGKRVLISKSRFESWLADRAGQ